MLDAAETAYAAGDFAQAGESYLNELPPSRYRVDPLHFLANQVNGADYFIIDVREPDEFAAGHIEGAVNMPLHELLAHMDEFPESKTAPILISCHTQKRATHAPLIVIITSPRIAIACAASWSGFIVRMLPYPFQVGVRFALI